MLGLKRREKQQNKIQTVILSHIIVINFEKN